MTDRQLEFLRILTRLRASLEHARKYLGYTERSEEQATLDELIAAYVQDVLEHSTRTRGLERPL